MSQVISNFQHLKLPWREVGENMFLFKGMYKTKFKEICSRCSWIGWCSLEMPALVMAPAHFSIAVEASRGSTGLCLFVSFKNIALDFSKTGSAVLSPSWQSRLQGSKIIEQVGENVSSRL